MILSDFFSRQKNDDSNPHEIIPLSFNMCQVLDNYYNEKYLIQTRSQTTSCGTKLLEVHGVGKNLNSNLKAREAACHTQTRKYGKATYRSGKSWIKKKET